MKQNMANLNYKTKIYNTKHIPPSSFLFIKHNECLLVFGHKIFFEKPKRFLCVLYYTS